MRVITIGEAKNPEQIAGVIRAAESGKVVYTTIHSLGVIVSIYASRLRSKGSYAKAAWLEHLHKQSGGCKLPRGYPAFVYKLGDI